MGGGRGVGLILNDYENIICNIVYVWFLFDYFFIGVFYYE